MCDFHACRGERPHHDATTMQKKIAELQMHFLDISAPMGATSCFTPIPKSLSYFDMRVERVARSALCE